MAVIPDAELRLTLGQIAEIEKRPEALRVFAYLIRLVLADDPRLPAELDRLEQAMRDGKPATIPPMH